MKPNWFDWLVYRLFRWRWNKILKSRPKTKSGFIAHLQVWGDIPNPRWVGELENYEYTIQAYKSVPDKPGQSTSTQSSPPQP